MVSFRETRNLVLECYVDGIIDEDDFMLLYDINQSKNPEFPHENYELFNFDTLDPVECVADFRVEKPGAPNANFRKISVRKTIWDLEFSEHLL